MARLIERESRSRRRRAGLAAAALVLLAACDRASDQQLVDEARSLFDKGDVAAAQIQLKNALDRNPESAAARLLLGQALLRKGDAAAALIELRKARAAGIADDQVVPDLARAMLATREAAAVIGQFTEVTLGVPEADADLRTSIGTAHATAGDRSAAREAAHLALRKQAGHMPAVLLLARLDLADGDPQAALRRLDDALARVPGHEWAGLLRGEILSRDRHRRDDALKAFRDVIAAHAGSVPARAAVVNLLLLRGQGAEARTEVEALRTLAPQHPETLMLQARLAFDARDFKLARETAERLLTRHPRHPQVLMLAGAAEYQMKQYAQADALFTRALKEEPGNTTARQMMARTFLRLNVPDKAVEVLGPATGSTTADATSLALLGEAQLAAGDAQQAQAALLRALKAAPGDAGVQTSLAVARLAQGDLGAALPQLEALARDERNTQADLALVGARLQRNDLAGALAAAEALVRKSPDRAQPLALRGRLQARLGQTAAAATSYEAALAKEPGLLAAVAGMAELDLAAGRTAQARQRFEALIKADGHNVPARLALNALDARLGTPSPALITQLREAVRVDPRQGAPHLLLVEQLLGSGDPQAALLAAQEAAAALPDDPAVLDALGRAQIAAGDSARAVTTFRRLTTLQPRRALHQVRLADAHLAAKDRAAAGSALRQALAIEPGLLMAERGLALIALAEGKPAHALALARAVQKRSPKEAAGFALEGELETAQRNWAAAASAYAAALQRSPSTDLAMRQHRSLVAAGKPAEAERMAARWLEQHPKDAGFLFHLGDMASARQELALAETRYRAVLALQPRHAVAMNNVAWLLATQGKRGGAEMAEAALKLLPDRAPLLDTLSLALEVDHQLKKAIEVQRRAAELEPRNPLLRLRLAKLLIKNGDRGAARDELESLSRSGKAYAGQDEVASLLKTL